MLHFIKKKFSRYRENIKSKKEWKAGLKNWEESCTDATEKAHRKLCRKNITTAREYNFPAIDLNGKSLTSLPPGLGTLKKLKILDLHGNHIDHLPSDLPNAPILTELNLKNNGLLACPTGLGALQKLKKLDLSDNQITSLSEEISQLNNLGALLLSNNQITNADRITTLHALKVLNLNNNLIADHLKFEKLNNLEHLHLDNNRLETFPDVGPKLEVLSLSHNNIKDFPKLFRSEKLITLQVSGNNIENLPLDADLPRLRSLYVTENGLSEQVPKNWGKASNLQTPSNLRVYGDEAAAQFPEFAGLELNKAQKNWMQIQANLRKKLKEHKDMDTRNNLFQEAWAAVHSSQSRLSPAKYEAMQKESLQEFNELFSADELKGLSKASERELRLDDGMYGVLLKIGNKNVEIPAKAASSIYDWLISEQKSKPILNSRGEIVRSYEPTLHKRKAIVLVKGGSLVFEENFKKTIDARKLLLNAKKIMQSNRKNAETYCDAATSLIKCSSTAETATLLTEAVNGMLACFPTDLTEQNLKLCKKFIQTALPNWPKQTLAPENYAHLIPQQKELLSKVLTTMAQSRQVERALELPSAQACKDAAAILENSLKMPLLSPSSSAMESKAQTRLSR